MRTGNASLFLCRARCGARHRLGEEATLPVCLGAPNRHAGVRRIRDGYPLPVKIPDGTQVVGRGDLGCHHNAYTQMHTNSP